MENIRPLSEIVHSSVRSGFIVSDLTRIVEELVYNSIDAGSSKVSVWVGVGTGFVKVDDDGHGITRDGLVVLGKRYATSKVCLLADDNSTSSSFGCYGEVLCSISDVSLLEIITKAHGRPNGYRKIMKGCNCLYLGIDDDDRQDTGTTVIVRDLFYNQPVRRRQMQSSPKKALHLIRECILCIALVRSKVSFRLFDIESEDELLHIDAASSTLSLLGSCFGIEASSLHDLRVCEGALKLVGYVSGPRDTSSAKAIQYIYINSRFVSKGIIHKALNRLANSYWDEFSGDKIGKRSRSQACPSYCLNLICPASFCDFSFELSRAVVEFKEWAPILLFIEKSVAPLWSRYASNGKSSWFTADLLDKNATSKKVESCTLTENDWSEACEISGKRCKFQNNWNQQAPSTSVSLANEMQLNDESRLSSDRCSIRVVGNSHRKSMKFEDPQTMTDFSRSRDILGLHHNSPSILFLEASHCGGDRFCEHTDELILTNVDILGSDISAIEGDDSYQDGAVSSSRWKDEYLKVSNADSAISDLTGSMGSNLDFECKGNLRTGYEHLFLRNCSSHGNLDQKIISGDGRSEFLGDLFRASEINNNSDRSIDILLDNELDNNLYISERMPRQDDVAVNRSSLDLNTENIVYRGSYSTSVNCPNSLLWSKDNLNKQHYSCHSVAEVGVLHYCCVPSNDNQCSDVSDSVADFRDWNLENIMNEEEVDAFSLSEKHEIYSQCMNRREKFELYNIGDKFSNPNIISSSYSSSTFLNDHLGLGSETDTFSHCCQLDDISLVMPRDVLFGQQNVSCLELFGKDERYLTFLHHSSLATSNGSLNMEFKRCEAGTYYRERSRRSHSAPPMYRGKRNFLSVIDYMAATERNKKRKIKFDARNAEGCDIQHQQGQALFPAKYQCLERHYVANSSIFVEEGRSELLKVTRNDIASQNDELGSPQQGLLLTQVQESPSAAVKWRHGCHWTEPEYHDEFQAGQEKYQHENPVLDISSVTLHLAGEPLVPKSIDRNFLEDAHVLLQLDKKFIPVVAGGTLAVIDQHAADERIRLEELHKKVLSGELKSVTYLEAEKELVLPETAHLLLYNYSERIQDWGWICNIYSQGSSAFTRNLHLFNGQPACVTLRAVPCILGVNLSATDLLEYLEQLAGTDGSSTIPPSVIRVLNYKSCRGAIMFGDAMLPSECSLLVEELKKTSLCFQCAHGRPTTVPLIDLNALDKQITKLRSWNDGSERSWHGLRRRQISLERAEQRLHLARRR